MILTAFENGIFPLRKQYPSGMDDWKDDMNWSLFLPEKDESNILVPLFQRKEKTSKEGRKMGVSELNKQTVEKEKIIKNELFEKQFHF